ncbi:MULTISPECIES: Asp-tRNA(Asn)/Glu-tRNA(Gln) amidotransferase subunit GatA [Desulfurella]|uniref:Glutamyl-tRNA(Gln) amidotransferase subunit A n=1 Tax=Desulfurella multipotens TaxID=79269 RepID=A0A1G6N2I6_9BACT|nr:MULTISPECIES: Asp-tRNA(Asn)/Glu-tRNA(Gln) amidotransferase subunit GatA [Desulfurella]PMP68923.1 MAG: Asp-tRNA(Asn)/Glu-tRNA(Gln) amidotransferase subunit GatA [Desulfurella multipotens]PMP90239.1 MAG: Asp-tRNA(Asn)/Glu-tRNA(Gln) amidotransferase subunit GatA [Desulfurella sp.]SDC62033.1 aspartyl/glutamyl-tRNA(Asn/Gln) amidotransferase subunit A [Desulfurella multipotens]HEX14306.1 Asp-tRNA(Asn)/Glu-tRNA(Gln) amidotransferase subunit GatA [Desulfurella acetivorans]
MIEKPLHELLDLIEKKEITAKEVFEELLIYIKSHNKNINAYISIIDTFEEKGSLLKGLPIAVKDNIMLKGTKTTCASKMLSNFESIYDATVIEKLKLAGANFIGKTNMDEFAMGSSCETSYFGPVRNPWDKQRVSGGSSGGSAASVASGLAIASLGSDTGGSIRQPASFCGVVGLKPTYGRVSRYGLVAFASSLDQIGPITRDVKDACLLLGIISGFDPKDSTSINVDVPNYTEFLSQDLKGIKIGVYEAALKSVSEDIAQSIENAIDTYKKLGAQIENVDLPHIKYSISDYYILACAEASSNLARFDGVKYGYRANGQTLEEMYVNTRTEGFGAEVKRRIMLGTYVLSSGYYDAYYIRSLRLRNLIKMDFDKAFSKVDAIILPTTPTDAFKIGEVTKPLDMYLSDTFTIPANLAGLPAISVPCGFSKNHLPLGLQILSNAFREDILLKVAYAFEQQHDFHKKIPIME